MKLICVNKSDSTIPYLICNCISYEIQDNGNVKIILDNAPYRTDGNGNSDLIIISSDNYEYPLDEQSVALIQYFNNQLNNQYPLENN